jgi:hypothetical protein
MLHEAGENPLGHPPDQTLANMVRGYLPAFPGHIQMNQAVCARTQEIVQANPSGQRDF